MSARRTFALTRRLLAQFRHDHRTIALLLVAPIVVLGIFALLFRTDGEPTPIAVLNQDAGPLGPAVVAQLKGSELVAIQAAGDDRDALEEALDAGEIAAYVVLPQDFSTRALTARAIAPEVRLRGTDPAASGTVQAALARAMVAAASDLVPPDAGVSVPRVEPETTYLFGGEELDTLDQLGGPFIGLVVFFLVYVVTSVSFLRERSLGTLERLMASPLRRAEIVVGYMLGFTAVALVQAAEVLLFGTLVLDLHNQGNLLLIFGIELLLALSAINLGIFLSTFARTEFQVVQFIPLVVVPQILLSGVLVPVASEPGWLQVISNLMPLTYAVDALRSVMLEGRGLEHARLLIDLGVLAGFCALVVAAAATTLRREVA
ncbi:MAG TPA: ABC transporter permease [candidate division Zixibacteria bacterium]|nr:ABC transporter permease [candidate division Zixibacteria bacterium]